MREKRKRITHEGELDINGLKIPCFVLDDGTRVLSGRGMQEALRIRDKPEDNKKRGGYILPTFFDSSAFKPLINNKLELAKSSPIICYKGNLKIHGYEATILADLCDLVLEARKQGAKFTKRQKIVADQCEVLMRAFAKVGIIALVDEATGYQYERERDELQKILKAYINDELLPWQKRFPDVYYKELFRLNGWDFTVTGIKKRPGVIGKWTNTLIYEQLPPGVLNKLKEITPKSQSGNYSARFHQSLTVDVGEPQLSAQLNQVLALFYLSDSMENMWHQFEKLKLRRGGQLEIPFEFDDKGHTKENSQAKQTLSSFNQNLKKLMNVPPPQKNEK